MGVSTPWRENRAKAREALKSTRVWYSSRYFANDYIIVIAKRLIHVLVTVATVHNSIIGLREVRICCWVSHRWSGPLLILHHKGCFVLLYIAFMNIKCYVLWRQSQNTLNLNGLLSSIAPGRQILEFQIVFLLCSWQLLWYWRMNEQVIVSTNLGSFPHPSKRCLLPLLLAPLFGAIDLYDLPYWSSPVLSSHVNEWTADQTILLAPKGLRGLIKMKILRGFVLFWGKMDWLER